MLKNTVTAIEEVLQRLNENVKQLQNEPTSASKFCKEFRTSTWPPLEKLLDDLSQEYNSMLFQLVPEDVNLDKVVKSEEKIGSGGFGNVYESELRGTKVAIKIKKRKENEEEEESQRGFENEIKTLRSLRHDNIVSFYGSGLYKQQLFIVMEHVKETLAEFVHSRSSDDSSGLSAYYTWHIARQLAVGLDFLHSKDIVHKDIKPDNILLDTSPILPKVKLCDFGLSTSAKPRSTQASLPAETQQSSEQEGKGHARYAPLQQPTDPKKIDVFGFGLVVLEMRTGKRPWGGVPTRDLCTGDLREVQSRKSSKEWYIRDIKISDDVLGGEIGAMIRRSCSSNRPNFTPIIEEFFKEKDKAKENPYKMKETTGEFFSCGFLTNTNIFVVDSMVKEDEVNDENLPTYRPEDLICEVKLDVEDRIPENEVLNNVYYDNFDKYEQMAERKEIDNNATVALKEIVTDREGEEESQKITLKFEQSTYVHHRAMRDIWRGFDELEKTKIVKYKEEVNPYYSTSFGLHVAILTNEGNGEKKFVFTQRSNKKGVASPGAYTCGAVESCSTKDYVKDTGEMAKVSLLNTASRGLHEELGLPLTADDRKAIHLNTTYLKFDNHEWGMCGFIDLTDERVCEENRFSFARLEAAFTSGPKDKFEHACIYGVDFKLSTMVSWIREHHREMASSGKIAVVKVLQAYFGTAAVTKEFEKYMKKDEEVEN